MSQNSQQKQSQLVKVLQRQNVISYKKKPKNFVKSHNNQDQDNISSQSLQSGVYSQDVNKIKAKINNNPLPQLGKDKQIFKSYKILSINRKRFINRNFLNQEVRLNNYQEKQVRQHDNLMLKQKNNFLSSENMKLKTKVSTLQKQNLKLQKILEQQPIKPNTPGLVPGQNKQRFRPNDNLSTKILIKNFKKQIQELKKQNANIKASIKFTTISELQWQRDAIIQQSNRLRAMLQEQQSKRINYKMNQQGISHLQHKMNSLQEKNNILARQNNQLTNKIKKYEQNNHKLGKSNQNQKNLNKMLYNVRRLLKQKQKQVQQLKDQIKTSSGSLHSIAVISQKSITSQNTFNQRKASVQKSNNGGSRNFQRRIISKSAQKINKLGQKNDKNNSQSCQNCKKYISQIDSLKKKLTEFQNELQSVNPLVLPVDPVQKPTTEQTDTVNRFISFRFKAHHLSLQQSQKYLLNTQNITDEQLKKQMTVDQFVQNILAQPFVMYNKRYIQVFVMNLCYQSQINKGSAKIKIDKNTKVTKKNILDNYKKSITEFTLMSQQKQQQMFLQIAQLVTSYYQHIIAALTNRKNGQGTISQKQLVAFFTEIQLEKQYIDFIITQIILESFDLEKLNYFAFFQIFYLPQDQTPQQGVSVVKKTNPVTIVDKKKRFQVDHVVKQQDEEYQQSRSYVDARQKTLSKRQESYDENQIQDQEQNSNDSPIKIHSSHVKEKNQQSYEEEFEQQKAPNQKKSTIKEKKQQNSLSKKQINKIKQKDQYQQEAFQQQKMNEQIYEQSTNKNNNKKLIEKPYDIKDIEDQYIEEFQN